MPVKRPLRWRPTYRRHTVEEVRIAWRGLNSVAVDYLQEEFLRMVDGMTEYERGINEGRRRLAGELITLALDDDEPIEMKKSTIRKS